MNEAPSVTTRQVAFLPWLRLKAPCHVAGVEFVPWRDDAGDPTPAISDASQALSAILASYVDRAGKPISNCVVVTIPGRGWDLSDEDFKTVRWAASLLFLGAWAANEYYPRFSGPYVNSTAFRVVWQRFSGTPTWIALTSRRRDGRTWDGGYRHGEVTFGAPLQCSFRDPATVDLPFLGALDAGHGADCETIRRLQYALPFVELANTDDDFMTEDAEAVLMGSAFEQLLRGDASSFKLGKKFGVLFTDCGRVTVQQAQLARPVIEIDVSDALRAAAQPRWWVHRKWIEELYDVRSKSIHRGTVAGRTWGWHPAEHLVMAAWVFPLAVKLLLQRDGHYTFTDRDRGRCLAVDQLLAATRWAEDDGDGSKWSRIVSETARSYRFDQITERFLARNPDLFAEESAGSAKDAEVDKEGSA